MTARSTPHDIDDCIAGFLLPVQAILQKIRATIQKAAPRAVERISYKMPAFAQDGILLYFAAFQKHVGIYPPVRGDDRLNLELARYRGDRGNLRLPLDEPIPYGLIRRLVRCRLKEHLERHVKEPRTKRVFERSKRRSK